jgi:hypothetical protein
MSTDLTLKLAVSKPVIKIKPKTDNTLVYKTVEEKRIVKDISEIAIEYDLVTVLATTDFQMRGKKFFSNTGWENNNWDRELLYPNIKIDVNHKGSSTFSGFIVAVEFHICNNHKRKQPGWKYERAMGYNIMTLLLPKGSLAQQKATSVFKKHAVVPVSIVAMYKSGKRYIVEISVCDHPRNHECFSICGQIDNVFYNDIYPKADNKIFSFYNKGAFPLGPLPEEIRQCALRQYSDVITYKTDNSITKVIRDVSPVVYEAWANKGNAGKLSAYNLFYKQTWKNLKVEKGVSKVSVLANMWKALGDREKAQWKSKVDIYNSQAQLMFK